MTDAEYEAQKARVEAILGKWVEPLYLKWWNIDIDWDRTEGPSREMQTGGGHWQTCFKVGTQWPYKSANIHCYLPTVMTMEDDALEEAVVHELMHIHVNETRQAGKDWLDHEERVCTCLAEAFICVRNYTKEGKL